MPVPHSLPAHESVSPSGQMTTTRRKMVSWLKTLCSFVLIKTYMREKNRTLMCSTRKRGEISKEIYRNIHIFHFIQNSLSQRGPMFWISIGIQVQFQTPYTRSNARHAKKNDPWFILPLRETTDSFCQAFFLQEWSKTMKLKEHHHLCIAFALLCKHFSITGNIN